MSDAPQFSTVDQMVSSQWLKNIKQQFAQDQWPQECLRCKDTEDINGTSIRLFSLKQHETVKINDYLQIGGVLDNICNSGCQFCNSNLSTKIGSLHGKIFPIVDNSSKFWQLPQEKIILLDINGGEPSASKNYKHLLNNLPPNLKTLRINTNASILLDSLENIANRGIEVVLTISFDGVGQTHEYVRWPIKWQKFVENVEAYRRMSFITINFWSTINALNINNFDKMLEFVDQNQFDHSFALLDSPSQLNIKFKNPLTLAAKQKYANHANPKLSALANVIAVNSDNTDSLDKFIKTNDALRGLNVSDYFGNIFG